MSGFSAEAEHSPVGHLVDRFEVIGEEYDHEENLVGADVLLDVRPIGSFFLRIITKQHFLDENLQNVLDGEYLEDLLDEDPASPVPPFVLNDAVITREILDRKFTDRVVETDLAACLVPLTDD